jgi:hypothetical protein
VSLYNSRSLQRGASDGSTAIESAVETHCVRKECKTLRRNLFSGATLAVHAHLVVDKSWKVEKTDRCHCKSIYSKLQGRLQALFLMHFVDMRIDPIPDTRVALPKSQTQDNRTYDPLHPAEGYRVVGYRPRLAFARGFCSAC